MDYRVEIRRIMELEGLSGKDLSSDLGMSYGYFRNVMSARNTSVFIWMRSFVHGYRFGYDFAVGAESEKKRDASRSNN